MNWDSVVSNVTSEFVRPRLHYVPPGPKSHIVATESLEFVADIGYLLDPWQEFQTEQSLLTDVGSWIWSCLEYGFLAPRQNGKGGVYTARTIIDLFHLPCYDHYGQRKPRLVVYTAHQFKTANEAFERAKEVIEGSDVLRKAMKRDRNGGIRNSALDKGFDLANGNRMRYLARSRGGSGRGWTIDTLLTDETQEMPRSAWDALKYTQRALPNPQRLLTGTVPEPENNSEVWTDTRDRGRRRVSVTSGWSEYSPDPDDPETAADMTKPVRYGYEVDPDLKYALATNPAFGIRITARQLLDDADGDAEGYKREVLDWWPDKTGRESILPNWASAHDPQSLPLEPVALSLEVAEDRRTSTIMATGARDDGLIHAEVIDCLPGTDWIADRIAGLYRNWLPQVVVLDVGGPAGPLAVELEDLQVPYRALTVAEIGRACTGLYDLLSGQRLRYRRCTATDRGVAEARWRPLGQSRGFRRDTEHAESLLALAYGTLAITAGLVPDQIKATGRVPQPSHAMYGFS